MAFSNSPNGRRASRRAAPGRRGERECRWGLRASRRAAPGRGQRASRAGEGAERVPLDGRPRRAENFDPEHLLAQSKQPWF